MNKEEFSSIAADLGILAAQQAIDTIIQIAETAPGNELLRIAILTNAFALIESKRRVMLQEILESVMPGLAEQLEETIEKLVTSDIASHANNR